MVIVHSLSHRGQEPLDNNAAKILWFLEQLKGCSGSFYEQYCEGGAKERIYYSKENGQKIQAIGDQITDWKKAGWLSDDEYYWLRASLVESADRVANTASVYGAYLKKVKKTAQNPLRMVALAPVPSGKKGQQHRALCGDASQIFKQHSLTKMTLTYLDPPYNSRQYSGNYHILETIAKWDLDSFTPRGKTGLRNASEQSSPFCSKVKAYKAFDQLFKSIDSEYLLFSYNNEGILSEEQLETLFQKHCSEHQFFKLNYGRFRADSDSDTRKYSADTVVEFLILGKKKELE